MKTYQSVVISGLMALALAACSTTSTGNDAGADTMSGSSGPGATGFGGGVPRTETNAEAVGHPSDAGSMETRERTRSNVSDTTVDPSTNTQ